VEHVYEAGDEVAERRSRVPRKSSEDRQQPERDDDRYDRYANLDAVSATLRTQGKVLKVIGLAGGGVALLGALMEASNSAGLAVAVAVAGVCGGGILYAAGLLIAAGGEVLLALGDIARNTAKRDGA
jgi:hypothetical protein